MPARSCATKRSQIRGCSETTPSPASRCSSMPTSGPSPSRTTASAWTAARSPRRSERSRARAPRPSWTGSKPRHAGGAAARWTAICCGVFYPAFMVSARVDVVPRRAGTDEAWLWSSDGKGTFTVAPAALADAPQRGTRVTLHLMEDAKNYTERFNLERMVKAQSGPVPGPIVIIDKPGAEPSEIADGAALWTKAKADI